jgi:hypothetical protein
MKRGILAIMLIIALALIGLVSAAEMSKCSELDNSVKLNILKLQEQGKTVILKEAEKIIENQYTVFLVDSYGKILKLKNIVNQSWGYDQDKVEFEDYLDHDVYTATITGEGSGRVIVGGITYNLTYSGDYVQVSLPPEDEIYSFENCQPIWCIDSDGGKNDDALGMVNLTKTGIHYEDMCFSINATIEYFCYKNGSLGEEIHNCTSGKMCSDGLCVKCIEKWLCNDLGECENGKRNRTCYDNNMCGTVDDKPPVEYNCTNMGQQHVNNSRQNDTGLVGGDRDSHNCIGSAGYSWCEEKGKCIRIWEENCSVPGGSYDGQDIEGNRTYISRDLERCKVVDYGCEIGLKAFSDNGGCGCEKDERIKVFPNGAKNTAREKYGNVNFNFIILRNSDSTVYELTGEKEGKIFGLFKKKGMISLQVDAGTGEIVKSREPWWVFMASGI